MKESKRFFFFKIGEISLYKDEKDPQEGKNDRRQREDLPQCF